MHQLNKYIPFPKCVFMLIYLAVPVKLLCSRYGMCLFVSKSIYSLAKPKSIKNYFSKFIVLKTHFKNKKIFGIYRLFDEIRRYNIFIFF